MKKLFLFIALLLAATLTAWAKSDNKKEVQAPAPKDSISEHQTDSATIVALRDSLRACYVQNALLEEAKKEYEKMLTFDDSCLVALALRRTKEAYNEKNVKTALGYESRIFSDQLRDKFAYIFDVLRAYGAYTDELVTLLRKAQNDVDRENPFMTDDYKGRYLTELHSTAYYGHYIKVKAKISLPVLDQVYEEADNRLQKHQSGQFANFDDLLHGMK